VAVLEAAAATVDVEEVGNGRAAMEDGQAENAAHVAPEGVGLGGGETRGERGGVDAGGEEGFVAIDVAHAGEAALVEEEGFDGLAARGQELAESGAGDFERLGAEFGQGRRGVSFELVEEPPAAEFADVAEADEAAAGETEVDMVMFAALGGGIDGKTAGHAEVDEDGEAAGEVEADEFSATRDAADGAAGEGLEGDGLAAEAARGVEVEAEDAAADEAGAAQLADYRFDFGEFGHGHLN
jgi:hypothetical protein